MAFIPLLEVEKHKLLNISRHQRILFYLHALRKSPVGQETLSLGGGVLHSFINSMFILYATPNIRQQAHRDTVCHYGD